MNTVKIYTLSCPITEQVKYVGQSINPNERYYRHVPKSLSKYNSACAEWSLQLKRQGLKPVLNIVDEVSVNEWDFWEQHYIKLFKSVGADLLNKNNGGRTAYFIPPPNRKKVYQIDRNLNIISCFDSMEEAERKTGNSNILIRKVCNRERISTGGYYWSHDPENFIPKGDIPIYYKVKATKALTGEIFVYDSVMDAERGTGVFNSLISRCCKGKKRESCGYKFCYA